MKKLFPVMTVTGLLSLATIAGYPLVTATPKPTGSISKIPVFLPRDAQVFLKNGQSRSGTLTKFDSRTKTITVELSGEPKDVKMEQIKNIQFQGEVKLKEGRAIVIRGDEEKNDPNRNRKRWQEPLRNFNLIDANAGKAEITLTSLKPLELRGIETVDRNNSYVVEEIQFTPSDKIEIQVNPR